MAASYTCPNPDCGVTLKTPNRVPVGKSVKCPKCQQPFVPEQEAEEEPAKPGETFKLADDDGPPKRKAATPGKPGAAAKKPSRPEEKKVEPPPPPPAPAEKKPFDDDDEDAESIKRGYIVINETEEEIKEAEKHKPTFTEVQDKFKKSARGPAQAMLVLPSQLLTAEGLITMVFSLVWFVQGMWPLVFNDAPPGDEETEEAFLDMALGLFGFFWGALVCFGASEMHELGSYTWSMVGAVVGVLPLLAGIFSIVMLQNPKVKAGFEEGEGGPDDEDEEAKKEGDDDEDDGDGGDEGEEEDESEDDDEEEDERSKKKKARKSRRDDDEEEDEKPKKKSKAARRRSDE